MAQSHVEPGQSFFSRGAKERQFAEIGVEVGQGAGECLGFDVAQRRFGGTRSYSHVTITLEAMPESPIEPITS